MVVGLVAEHGQHGNIVETAKMVSRKGVYEINPDRDQTGWQSIHHQPPCQQIPFPPQCQFMELFWRLETLLEIWKFQTLIIGSCKLNPSKLVPYKADYICLFNKIKKELK